MILPKLRAYETSAEYQNELFRKQDYIMPDENGQFDTEEFMKLVKQDKHLDKMVDLC